MNPRYQVPYIPLGSTLGDLELQAVQRVITSGESLSCGIERERFEEEFAAYVGVPHAISVTNCTVALELATYLANIGPGDEVIAPTQTYQATVQPLLGRDDITVRFCDVDPDTLNIDPGHLQSLISDKTRAIYLVHYGGTPVDMTAVTALARDYGVIVVEDCAHSLGASYHAEVPGSLGDIGCFSFQSYKNMTTLGEGGMITVKDERLAEVLRRIRAIEPDADFRPRSSTTLAGHAPPTDAVFRHDKNAYTDDCVKLRHPGTNSTLAEPAAAVGRVQLQRLPEFTERRTAIAERLDAGLRAVPGIRVQIRSADVVSAHHLYTCFLDPAAGISRDALIDALDEAGIEVVQRYFPIHLLPEWRHRGHGPGECPVAERLWFDEQINLPIYPQMADAQVEYVISTLAQLVADARRS